MTGVKNPDHAPFRTHHREVVAEAMRAWLALYGGHAMQEVQRGETDSVRAAIMGEKRAEMRSYERELLDVLTALHGGLEHEQISLFAHRRAEWLFTEAERYARIGQSEPEQCMFRLAAAFEVMAVHGTPEERLKTRYIVARSGFWCFMRGGLAKQAEAWALETREFFRGQEASFAVEMGNLALSARRVIDGTPLSVVLAEDGG